MSSAFLQCLLVPLVGAAALGAAILECGPAAEAGLVDPPAAPSAAAIRTYRSSCLKCHDTDGRGEIVRDVMPEVPDFTDAAWQSSRTDAELGHSILEGKGKSMRPMRNKLGSVGVSQMVALVRTFRGGKQVVDDDEKQPARLQPAAGPTPAAGPRSPSAEPARPSRDDLSLREPSRIFLRTCARCHARDGRGSEMRDSLPSSPGLHRSRLARGARRRPTGGQRARRQGDRDAAVPGEDVARAGPRTGRLHPFA